MSRVSHALRILGALAWMIPGLLRAQAKDEASSPAAAQLQETNASVAEKEWNWHLDNNDVIEWHPGFPAQYTGPNSLSSQAQSAETITFDVTAGFRLWEGAEFHLDGLAWQGFGLSHTLGIESFPNAEAYKIGAPVANATFSRVFLRQTIGLGGPGETAPDDSLHVGGRQDSARVVLTVGQLSAIDIFDNNSYAGNPETQFLNWAFVGNEAWDYPANSLGYISGFAAEWYQPPWALRYGFFQMPEYANGVGIDPNYLEAWGMVTELERRFQIHRRPGTVRLLAFLNRARMDSLEDAVDAPTRPATLPPTTDYRSKYGFCLNMEQELISGVGVFTRLGWNDGKNQSFTYADVDRTASMGASVSGIFWGRPDDTFAVAGVVNGISGAHQEYFEAGGLGILAGDGALNYGLEKAMETYYNFKVRKNLRVTADYQFMIDPAYNRARGPVSVLGGRLHWDY